MQGTVPIFNFPDGGEIAAAAGLEYRVNQQQIVLSKPASGNTDRSSDNNATYSFNGFVSDAATGEKLIGATVFDLKTQSGTITIRLLH